MSWSAPGMRCSTQAACHGIIVRAKWRLRQGKSYFRCRAKTGQHRAETVGSWVEASAIDGLLHRGVTGIYSRNERRQDTQAEDPTFRPSAQASTKHNPSIPAACLGTGPFPLCQAWTCLLLWHSHTATNKIVPRLAVLVTCLPSGVVRCAVDAKDRQLQ
jgi:hypothetical protein